MNPSASPSPTSRSSTPASPSSLNPPAPPTVDLLDDIFGAADDDENSYGGDAAPLPHRERSASGRELHPSDMERLRAAHATAGYREAVAGVREGAAQEGFDEGFLFGAAVGVRAGFLLGVLESLEKGLEQGEAGKGEDRRATLVLEELDVLGGVLERHSGLQTRSESACGVAGGCCKTPNPVDATQPSRQPGPLTDASSQPGGGQGCCGGTGSCRREQGVEGDKGVESTSRGGQGARDVFSSEIPTAVEQASAAAATIGKGSWGSTDSSQGGNLVSCLNSYRRSIVGSDNILLSSLLRSALPQARRELSLEHLLGPRWVTEDGTWRWDAQAQAPQIVHSLTQAVYGLQSGFDECESDAGTGQARRVESDKAALPVTAGIAGPTSHISVSWQLWPEKFQSVDQSEASRSTRIDSRSALAPGDLSQGPLGIGSEDDTSFSRNGKQMNQALKPTIDPESDLDIVKIAASHPTMLKWEFAIGCILNRLQIRRGAGVEARETVSN